MSWANLESQSSLGRVTAWWLESILGLIPDQLAELFGAKSQLELVLDAEKVTLFRRTRRSIRKLAEATALDALPPTLAPEDLRRFSRIVRAEDRPGTVVLSGSTLLSTVFDLPITDASNLPRRITQEIDRFTPFRPEQIYFDYRVLSADMSSELITCELVFALKNDVESAQSLAQSIGLKTVQLTGQREPGAVLEEINLLRSPTTSGHRRLLTKMVQLSALCACLSGVFWAIGDFFSTRAAISQVEAEIEEIRRTARDLGRFENELNELRVAYEHARSAAKQSANATGTIALLTKAITDDHYLITFSLEPQYIALAGHSKDASALLLMLEKQDRINGATFTAPVTSDPDTGLDRFFIEATLSGSREADN